MQEQKSQAEVLEIIAKEVKLNPKDLRVVECRQCRGAGRRDRKKPMGIVCDEVWCPTCHTEHWIRRPPNPDRVGTVERDAQRRAKQLQLEAQERKRRTGLYA